MTNDTKTTYLESDSTPAVPDVFPDFAISLEEANRRVKMLQEFVRDHMVEGEDYGVIPGTSTKPTLFKPGAEKLNAIFGLAPVVEITNRVEDWDTGFVAYEVKVTLINKRTTNVEAEGIGSCNSRERRYKNQDAANIANTILKMSKKRAMIDATLSATRASGMFTQDLEDMEAERPEREYGRTAAPAGPFPAGQPRAEGNESSDEAERRFTSGQQPGGGTFGGGTLTEAQRGAILAIANKAFGRAAKEELSRVIDKPIDQLTKSEASSLIDHLRTLLPEQPQPSRDNRPTAAAEHAVQRNGSGPR